MGEQKQDERATMGLTSTPGTAGADAIDEDGTPNGSAVGAVNPLGLGGQADPPGLPFEHKVDSQEKAHGPQLAAERGEGGN